ncbi:aminotransferase class I/II-fold pyridoxal phosphate-dependent enzyme [Propionibacterium freudenreichii]|uniref:aminotransferase class I/II-fold pyridoxal phosphate-dependent enzyme n=1 Tax=Propionibacterium freudenreichii TaxID=1744 RepID=UPI0021A2D71D|nr:aminotransferase class I/II-fold pyridoxal phosphate-dependent enzyme [Propionibacterium freudenreichii]MCT2997240.1 aminotransferase class I/II-fold pyridoxal phosphate-dependent enzyme [Propionibacterium freudenreichii]MCT3001840.1 aminotransferase class I/II-fold pyridoxal phosphate-dependent enzyme [Propionibacterium freudenreichii]MDK9658116.1 aminotransferase class I/II-fold pyridoxal phosphate-dependent enzyme [Propionibacterium freudenreichii]
MTVSHRARNAETFHALDFAQRAADLEAQGHHVVKLSIGEPDFGAPPAVLAAGRDALDGRPLPYTPPLGLPELRSALSDFYRDRHGVQVPAERIAITMGASAALLLATAATTDPGDEVILADPSYPCNRELVKSFGGTVVALPTTAATRYQLDADMVERAWGDRTTSVMIASPSNPTGTSIPFDELAAICELARSRGGWRIVDEIYLELSDASPAHTVLEVDPDAIVTGSFSKYFGMTGWRLGWAVLPPQLVGPVERLAMNYFLSASNPTQQAALACFTPETLEVCERRRRELGARRRLVLEGLARIGLPVPVVPDGAFYVYIDVSGTGLGAWQFCEQALDVAHVALTPGRDFGPTTGETHVRLSYAASRGELDEGLSRLGHFLASRRG